MPISKKEDVECEKFATWLDLKNYRFTHVANETGIGGLIWMKIWSRNKKIGVAKWFPDYIIFLKRGGTLFLEMKLPKKMLKNGKLWASPSKISTEQKEWIEFLNNSLRWDAWIAYWAEDAIRIVENAERCFNI